MKTLMLNTIKKKKLLSNKIISLKLLLNKDFLVFNNNTTKSIHDIFLTRKNIFNFKFLLSKKIKYPLNLNINYKNYKEFHNYLFTELVKKTENIVLIKYKFLYLYSIEYVSILNVLNITNIYNLLYKILYYIPKFFLLKKN